MVVRNGVERGGEVSEGISGVGERDGRKGGALCKKLAMWEAAFDHKFKTAADGKDVLVIQASRVWTKLHG